MIKRISYLVVLTLISHIALGQPLREDSLRNVLTDKRIDSLKSALITPNKTIKQFDLLNHLVLELTGYRGNDVDSTYNLQMLEIAQELKSDSLLAISYNWLGTFFYSTKGDNTTGLEYYFKAIPLAKSVGDKRRLSSLYFDIALIYFDLRDNDAALKYTRLGGNNLPARSHLLYDFMLIQYLGNMTQYFLQEKQLDSALFYVDQFTLTNDKVQKIKGIIGSNYGFLFNEITLRAAVYSLNNDDEKAVEYFRRGLAFKGKVQSSAVMLLFFNTYVPYLISNSQMNEAKLQSKQLLEYGDEMNNDNLMLAATAFLRQIFELSGQIDSAYYYSQMEADINKSIFSRNNINRIQAIVLNERINAIEMSAKEATYKNQLRQYGLLAGLGMVLMIAFILYRNNKQKQKANTALEETLSNLKSTQTQLIQSEKMASLGELTAGIAHEIQNPLNFVNNFSEVSEELVTELKGELEKGDFEEVKAISEDVKENLKKINHHGQRASGIVKGMLQHSRTSTGEKELTDINALADEYLRLAYHGLRAKDKSFNADFKTDLDDSLPKINVIPQDMGRVLLNLINNAFHAVTGADKPKVLVQTRQIEDTIEIRVSDNGSGIPDDIKDKIFQPFFTTKAAGEGTGLGLSLSYDIVTKGHGGELKVETKEGEGTEFIVILPVL